MRKIFNICILFAVAAGFIACSDDNDAGSSYLRKNPVNVVSSKLLFSAAAQKGGGEIYCTSWLNRLCQ